MTPTIDEPSERDDTDFELHAVDTTGDGVADAVVHERVEAVDTDGDGIADSAVLRRTTMRDTTGDGTPDTIELETDQVTDLDGDGRLEVLHQAGALRLDTGDRGVVGLAGLHHVSVTVRDNGAARGFFVDLLGLVELPRPDFGFPGSWLGTPDGRQVHLIEGDAAPSSGNHVAFAVPDAAAAVASLRAAGLEVGDPVDGPGGRQVFLTDPSGNLIELNEQR